MNIQDKIHKIIILYLKGEALSFVEIFKKWTNAYKKSAPHLFCTVRCGAQYNWVQYRKTGIGLHDEIDKKNEYF